jgi:hypothetical protein
VHTDETIAAIGALHPGAGVLMPQPWGLSGPQFLGAYSIAFVAALLLMIVPRYSFGLGAKGKLTPRPADVGLPPTQCRGSETRGRVRVSHETPGRIGSP